MSSSSDISDVSEDENNNNDAIEQCPSIDDLLEERERESREMSEYSEKTDDDSITCAQTFVPPFSLSKVKTDDPIIFAKTDFEFPKIIFEFLHSEEADFTTANIEPWMLLAIKYYSQQLPIKPEFYFSLVNYLIYKKDEDVGHFLIKYGAKLPKGCLDFPSFIKLFKLCSEISPEMLSFILGSIEPTNMAGDRIPITHDFILMHAAMLFTTKAVNVPYSYHAIEKLRRIFDYGSLPEEVIEEIGNAIIRICQEKDANDVLSQFTTYFPINGAGSGIMIFFGRHIIKQLMKSEAEPLLDNLPVMLENIKLVSSADPSICSAIVSVLHATVSAAMKDGEIDQDTVGEIIEKLKFTIPCHDPILLTLLKEQLQVTRTQLDILMRSNYQISSQTYG